MKSVALTVLELLAFNTQKFRGHATFRKILGVMSGLSPETCPSNLNSVALTVLELLALTPKNLEGYVTVATSISAAAQKYFIWDVKGKLCSKFGEDRSKTEVIILSVVAGWTDTGRTLK